MTSGLPEVPNPPGGELKKEMSKIFTRIPINLRKNTNYEWRGLEAFRFAFSLQIRGLAP